MCRPQLRHTNQWEEVSGALAAREASLNFRSRQLIDGAAALSAMLGTSHTPT